MSLLCFRQSFTAISLYLNKCKAEQCFTAISLYSGILIKRPLNKGTAEQIEGYFASVFKAEQSFTAISQSFTAIYLYAGILLERPMNMGTAEQRFTAILQSFTAISLYAGILQSFTVISQRFTAISQSFNAISLYVGMQLERPLSKHTAEQIEGYVSSVQSFTVISQSFTANSQSFNAISLYEGIQLERPLSKRTAEQIEGYVSSLNKGTAVQRFTAISQSFTVISQSFTAISLYAGKLMERLLNKGTAEKLSKGTAEQIEGYVSSLNKGTAVQSFTAISQSFTVISQSFTAISESYNAISLYAGIQLERPLSKRTAEQIEGYVSSLNKGTAVQSFTAISQSFTVISQSFTAISESYNAISLYAGIQLERPLSKRTAEQIEGYVSSLNKGTAVQSFTAISQSFTVISQSFTAISLYAGKLMERPLNRGTAEKLSKGTAEQIEGYVSSLNKGTAVQSFTAISQSFTVISQSFTAISESYNAISLYAGIQLERPLSKRTAEQIEGYVSSLNKGTAVQSFTAISQSFTVISQSFTAISLYAGKLMERPLNRGTAEKLSKGTAEQIEGYVSSLNKGTAVQSFTAISQSFTVISQSFTAISQSFNAISLYAGIQLERPLSKGTAEQIEGYVSSLNKGTAVQSFTAVSQSFTVISQSFTAISLYAGKLMERPLNKGTAEKLSKRTAEQIEGYVSSLNKGTAVQSFTAISQSFTVISQSFTAISESYNAISLYAGIQLERPLSKRTAEQIEGYVSSLNKGTAVQSFTAISQSFTVISQSFTAISLYAGKLMERPLNRGTAEKLSKGTAEQIEGYVSSLNKGTAVQSFTAVSQSFTVISQSFTAISLYAGKLMERLLNKGTAEKLSKRTAEQIEGYVSSLNKGTAVQSFTAISQSFTVISQSFTAISESYNAISLYAGIQLERP
ncbi:hypothetical protein P7K49_039978, partial [Saguinus oedipus]